MKSVFLHGFNTLILVENSLFCEIFSILDTFKQTDKISRGLKCLLQS